MHGVGVAKAAADQVFEPLVGVEAAAVRTNLRDPTPDSFRDRVDFDTMSPRPDRGWDELIAGERFTGRRFVDSPMATRLAQERRQKAGQNQSGAPNACEHTAAVVPR